MQTQSTQEKNQLLKSWSQIFGEEMQFGNRCFDLVPTTGRGSSLKDGLVKNLACKKCNLYPEKQLDVMFRPRKSHIRSLDKSSVEVHDGKGTKRKAEEDEVTCKRQKC